MEPRPALENAQHELLKALAALYQNPNAFLRPFAETPEQAMLALARQPDFFGPYRPRLTTHDKAQLLRDVHQAAMHCFATLAQIEHPA